MADYPAHLVREHRLANGTALTIRPVRPQDAGLTRALLDGLSEQARRLRFKQAAHAASPQLIGFLTDVDYERHMAFLATIRLAAGEQAVGEARYLVEPDGRTCEFAIAVADAWQGTGVAGLLMEALFRAARAKGLKSVAGLVAGENARMLRFVHALGFEAEPAAQDPRVVRVLKRL
ncbi:MAG TPA: GNAT family N-acetyltransferase [Burkholderiales bacterium]|nr:GNAT family N-acetyltransferase [Burkholderiales bacterium]